MIQWGPDTQNDGWYHYSDKTIRGFSLTHISGAGCSIYADVPILPWTGDPSVHSLATPDFALSFSHRNERAKPGYYSVVFDDGISAKLTVAKRAGIGQFQFPAHSIPSLIFKAGASATNEDPKRASDTSSIEIRGNDTLVGTVHSGGFCGVPGDYVLYFVARFAKPFTSHGTWTDMRDSASFRAGANSAEGHRSGAVVSFPEASGPILLKTAISFVSIDNAMANLQAEIPEWNFEQVHNAAQVDWTRMLGRINIAGGTPKERTIFYTALYHMLLSPNLFNDGNGDYIGFDKKVRRLHANETQYANFSDWDIYRNVIQLQSLLLPDTVSQMMQSLMRDAEQSGSLPRWPVANDVSYVMGGDSPAILLATSYAFGAKDFDTATALAQMVKGATQPGIGPHGNSERPFLRDYLSKGYVPTGGHVETGASMTLEYASADFAISRFAAALGHSSEADGLLRSSQNWRTLFDQRIGFIRPRTEKGDFLPEFDAATLMPHHQYWDEADQLGFEEGSTWQYTWMVPHNYFGLFQMMGGNEKVVPKLDRFFAKLTGWATPNFMIGNEPDFCAPYAYVWTGNAWKTQEVVNRIRQETFGTGPEGIPGNDDLGATSGVYVWSALGMYPVIPGVGGLVLSSPMFRQVDIELGAGRILSIKAQGKGIYVRQVKLNGAVRNGAWLPLETLKAGRNELVFSLQATPNKTWASSNAFFPPSFDVPAK